MINPEVTLDALNGLGQDTLVSHLGIEFTDVGPEHLTARMPVDSRTVQPYRALHGGASVSLAESVGSTASACCLDMSKQGAVGLEISANHLRSVQSGYVHATARPLHIGKRTHVWDIRLVDDEEHLVCVSRLTMMVIDL